jgi:hypothetical protein
MKYFCKIERHTSSTTFNLSFVKKLVRVQLINSCALIIISHMILIKDKKFIWLQGGLLYDAFFLMLSKVAMFVIGPLLSFNQYKKWYKRKQLKKDPKKSSLLQYEANELFTGSEIHLGSAFGSAIQTYYVCIFFLPILPSAGYILLVGILVLHYSQKYRFARWYKRPAEINTKIAIDAIYRLGFGAILLFVSILQSWFIPSNSLTRFPSIFSMRCSTESTTGPTPSWSLVLWCVLFADTFSLRS